MLGAKYLYLLILGLFAILMSEYLNYVTMGVIIVGLVANFFNKRPSKFVRSFLALLLFGLYWMVYGKMIEPEIGLNFLTSIIILKLLERDSLRDDYMIFYGTLLLIASGTLFEKNLTYSFYSIVAVILLISNFLRVTKQDNIILSASKSLIWMLPLSFFLFVFTPRIPNPLNMNDSAPSKGEIGYTTSVMISEIDSLKSNSTKVFHAKVDSPLPLDLLYWRGNVLEFTDGWNWPFMETTLIDSQIKEQPSLVNYYLQDIKLLSKQDYFFGLDWPGRFQVTKDFEELSNSSGTLRQKRRRSRLSYSVQSLLSSRPLIKVSEKNSKHTGLKKTEEKWIHDNFHSEEAEELIKEISDYFSQNQFSYTLAPGRIDNLLDFMTKFKKGYCSHYASSVALIMRAKGFTVRLVSGFLGGEYNKYASFYTVSHNDAHVWIEYLKDGVWTRLDPTTWIVPERVLQSSEVFIENQSAENQFGAMKFLKNRFVWFNDFSQWMAHLDYRYNIWIEELDFYAQEEIFARYKYNKKLFIPILLVLLIVSGFLYFKFLRSDEKLNDIEKLWALYKQKIPVKTKSISEDREIIKNLDKSIQNIFEELLLYSYKRAPEWHEYADLKERIKRINLQL